MSGDGAGGTLPREVGDRLAMVRTAGPTSELGLRELALWLLASACRSVTIAPALTRWMSS